MGVMANIQAALDQRLNTYATGAALTVAWENIDFTPPENAFWLRPTLLPGQTVQATLGASGGQNHFVGIYQISVFAPAGAGSGPGRDIAEALISTFKRGTSLTYGGDTVRLDRVWRDPARQEADWYHIPVSVRFFAFAENA